MQIFETMFGQHSTALRTTLFSVSSEGKFVLMAQQGGLVEFSSLKLAFTPFWTELGGAL